MSMRMSEVIKSGQNMGWQHLVQTIIQVLKVAQVCSSRAIRAKYAGSLDDVGIP